VTFYPHVIHSALPHYDCKFRNQVAADVRRRIFRKLQTSGSSPRRLLTHRLTICKFVGGLMVVPGLKRSLRFVAFAASRINGMTLKIS
jgi:hypothetical protein